LRRNISVTTQRKKHKEFWYNEIDQIS